MGDFKGASEVGCGVVPVDDLWTRKERVMTPAISMAPQKEISPSPSVVF